MSKDVNRGILLNYLLIAITNLSSILLTPLLVRGLGADEYGLYTLSFSAIAFLMVGDMGLGNFVVRTIAKYRTTNEKREQENFLMIAAGVYGIVMVLFVVICLLIGQNALLLFSDSLSPERIGQFQQLLYLFGLTNLITVVQNFFFSYVIAYERIVFTRLMAIARIIIRTAAFGVIALSGLGAAVMLWFDVGLSLLLTVGFALYAVFATKMRIRYHHADRPLFRQTLRFTLFVYAAQIVDMLYWSIVNLVAGAQAGTAYSGVLYMAMTFTTIYIQIAGTISAFFMPACTRLVLSTDDNREITDFGIRLGRIQAPVLGLMLLGFGFVGQSFLRLWVGEDFVGAHAVTLPVMIAFFYPLAQSIVDMLMQAKNRYGVRLIVNLASAVCTALLAWPLTARWGAFGAGLSIAISVLLFKGIGLNVFFKREGFLIGRFFVQVMGRMLPVLALAGVGLWALFLPIQSDTLLMFVLKAVIIVVVYAALLWFLYLRRDERGALLSWVKGKLRRG